MRRFTLLSLLIILPASPLIADPQSQGTEKQRSAALMSQMEKAEYLLENGRDVDPLAIDQAQAIIAGKPGKRWKNCILDKEVARTLTSKSSHVTSD